MASEIKNENKKEIENVEVKEIIPDQLNITIRTSIPGYQNISYKPSMTIKNSDEKTIQFNPLIRLNQNVVNSIPPEYRIKEFFNKGLFQSLITYNKRKPAANLSQATRYGNVDNNIKVTLNTIFPSGSVIYIGNNPYVISDVQWTTGDWNIETKQKKPVIDPKKVIDPILYTQLVREEIISGEDQLNQMPQSIKVGSNYSGSNVAKGIQQKVKQEPVKQESIIKQEPVKHESLLKQEPVKQEPIIKQEPIKKQEPIIKQEPIKKQEPVKQEPVKQESIKKQEPVKQEPVKKQESIKKQEQVKKQEPVKKLDQTDNEQQINPMHIMSPTRLEEMFPEEERLYEGFKIDDPVNVRESNFMNQYFQNRQYYDLIKKIYFHFPENLQKEIHEFYINTTNDTPNGDIKEISSKEYNLLCENTTIISTAGDGDCFFKSVANGININNFENHFDSQMSKITYMNYGKTQLFTVRILREIVLMYFLNLSDERINEIMELLQIDVDILNEEFEQSITMLRSQLQTEELPKEIYLDTINNIYNSKPNFLVYKPTQIPIEVDKYDKPFKILNKNEIPSYIRSKNYWANAFAIEAICFKLKICIIPIEKYQYKRIIENKENVFRLKSLLVNNSLTKEKCNKKIMFLYHTKNHYELINFKYKTKEIINKVGEGLRQEKKYTFKQYTIFNENDFPPPIHILFLIYGSIYSQLDQESKEQFSIYTPVMSAIESSVIHILNQTFVKRMKFVKYFDDYFPSGNNKSILRLTSVVPSSSQSLIEEKDQSGGEYSNLYSNPYSYPYSNPMTKLNPYNDSSKIAYSITIDMELHPGTSLTPQQLSQSKCNSKYNAIRKAFAEFTGRPYILPPVYNNTRKTDIDKKGGRKTRRNK